MTQNIVLKNDEPSLLDDVNFYILAGGKSSRMGHAKALLQWNETTIIENIINVCQSLSNRIFLVSSLNELDFLQLPIIQDHFADFGPGAGIDACLQHSHTSYNCILSCDMPFIDTLGLQHLISYKQEADIIVSKDEEQNYYFPGMYATTLKYSWRKMLLEGTKKMSHLIENHSSIFANSSTIVANNPYFYQNINTPKDYHNASQWIKK